MLQEKIDFSSPLKISLIGTSAAFQKLGYSKYLISFLDSAISGQERHSFNQYCLGDVLSLMGCYYAIRYNVAESNDLLLIDFCINDRNLYYGAKAVSRLTIGRAVEGLIRYVKKVNSKCRIVFINLSSYHDAHLERIQHNTCEISTLYSLISDYYNVPVINVFQQMLTNRGRDYVKSLYEEKDTYHPSQPLGAKIIGDLITRNLNQLYLCESFEVELPEPIYPKDYSDLSLLEAEQLETFIEGGYSKRSIKNSLINEDYFSLKQSSSIEFYLRGELSGIYFVASQKSGYILIKFGDRQIAVSLYSKWNQNNQASLLCRFIHLSEHELTADTPIKVQICLASSQNSVEGYKQDYSCQIDPVAYAEDWELNIIGIGYLGAISQIS